MSLREALFPGTCTPEQVCDEAISLFYEIASPLSGLATPDAFVICLANQAMTYYFSFQFTGNTTYTKRVQLGVPNVILDPFGM